MEKPDKKGLSRKTGFFVPKKAEVGQEVRQEARRSKRRMESGARSRTKSEKTDRTENRSKPSEKQGKNPEIKIRNKTGKKSKKIGKILFLHAYLHQNSFQ